EEANDRVLTVTAGVSVTLDGLTLQHGHPLACPMYGGAFINNGQLTLQNCIIRNNLGQAGGGIMNAGALTLIDVTLRDNASTGTGHHGNGGGIKSMDGSLTLIDATIMNNTSHREGGGIYLSCKSTLTLINSTLSGNTAGSGGGLYVKGVAHLIHGTIFDNHALTTGGGVYIEGSRERGVIHGTMHLTNTVIASNSAGLEKYGVADCMMGNYATLGVHTNTWVEDGTCNATFAGDPELGPLRDHGDGHYVHAPEPSSPLVDAVTAAACPLETDQRGSARSGSACDIGAVELPVPQLPATVIASVGGLLGLAALSSWLLFRYRRRRAPLP
ncbi:MAG: right-handed parallel beta-helix repeat-containing protein, partial [Anaerolineae bacterium]|nr:right-handed parallel beta-helix repeat-containing protein [Anaerolineae bacterium]